MEKIIITGGSGFIGTNMVEFYLDKGLEILNLDIAKPLKQQHGLYWKECDINDAKQIKNIINKIDILKDLIDKKKNFIIGDFYNFYYYYRENNLP